MTEPTTLSWIPVAFVRQTSGRLHVLFALELDGSPQHEGEPVLLVDHRPGAALEDVAFEAADVVEAAVTDALPAHRHAFAACITGAFARDGSFDADALLAQRVRVDLTP